MIQGQACRECGGPLPANAVVAQTGKHPEPGSYCSVDCVLAAFIRGHAYHATLYKTQFTKRNA